MSRILRAALLIAASLLVLLVVRECSRSTCSDAPSFFLRGTHLDCGVRS